jgi:hypothetical protein
MSSPAPDLKESSREPVEDVFQIPSPDSVGFNAGKVWDYLNRSGETSILKLKTELQCTAIHLSLGWLLREDKIRISRRKGTLFVGLKRSRTYRARKLKT